MKFKWDFLKRSPRCGLVWKLYASHPCAPHTPFKRTESIWCAIMGIRTPLVHDTPLSVYCLTPQIKFYLCRKSVGNFRTLSLSLPLFFFFFVLPLILLPITFQLFGTCLKMKWFDRPGLRSSSLCFESQEVYSTEFWLLECFHLALTSRELSESGGASVKNLLPMQETQETRFCSCVRKMPWRRKRQPTPVFLTGKSHEQRSLAGYSPWGHRDMTEHTHTHNWMNRILNVDRVR